jgi:Uma2 family endonuclease
MTRRRYTLQDLDSFPDDGNRYELVDGILLVTPAPLPPHDAVATRVIRELIFHFGLEPPALVSGRGVVEIEPNVHMEPDVLDLDPTRRTRAVRPRRERAVRRCARRRVTREG